MRCALALAIVVGGGLGCGDNRTPAEHVGTRTFLSPTEHLTRASLALRGVRPSVDELRAVAADPDRLTDLVDGYLHTAEFGATVRELHDEALLLRVRDRQYTLPAVDKLEGYTFDQIDDSIYGEPLHLIEDVVTTDQPYTRIVTADYTMADPIVAAAWGLDRAEDGPGWTRASGRPPAGIIGIPAIYMRYRSTATNYNRGRANAISRGLLCHDFLDSDIAIDTSVDLSDPVAVSNAVVANPSCAGCHQALDPLASYFFRFGQGTLAISTSQKYPYQGYYSEDGATGWFLTNDRPPAYFGQQADGLDGLGRAIAADPRFARCAAIHFASYLTEVRTDALSADWIAQLQEHFRGNDYNARMLAREIVFSDQFRVAYDDDETAAQGVVGYQKLRPAQLARMIEAITGYRWTQYSPAFAGIGPYWPMGTYDVLDDDLAGYRVLDGGTDDFPHTDPVFTMNATASLVTRRLAYQAAAYMVANDARYHSVDDAREKLVELHAKIYSELVGESDVDDELQLLQSIDDPQRAWTITIAAMLSDLRASVLLMKRRDLLKLGALGAVASTFRGVRADAPARTPKRLVIVFQTGGWDTTYVLDPKTPDHADLPAGAVQQFGGLDVFVDPSRQAVTDFFTQYASLATIVRGISVEAINHLECIRRIATGTREETSPDVGAMVAHDLANELPLPYLVLGAYAFAGPYAVSSGRIGATNQLATLVTPPDGPSDAEAALMRRYAQASVDRAHATRGARGYNRARVDDFLASIDRAAQLRGLSGVLGQRGDTLALAQQIPIAIDALAQDLSHAVMVSAGSSSLMWDTHADNAQQGPMYQDLYTALDQLVGELVARPGRAAGTRMIDDTNVLVMSEMSRTPHLNGAAGKDHWPVTSAMLISATGGGRVLGGTDPDTNALLVDFATGAVDPSGQKLLYTNFAAGVLAACGVDPSTHMPQPPLDALAAT